MKRKEPKIKPRYAPGLTKTLEDLWSFVIRSRAGFRCEVYGQDHLACRGYVLEAMHLVTRGVKGVKFDQRNGRSGCNAHHKYYTHRPHEWSALCERLWPSDWAYVNDKKWNGASPDIDKIEKLQELYYAAQIHRGSFPEYEPKLKKIDEYVKTNYPAIAGLST